MSARDDRPRVLVLGGGFGGLGAALKLRKADADVVLVDRHDYHTFQPLLYQLATGLLEPSAVGHSLRDLVHHDHQDNVTVHKTPVTAIDLEAREVTLADMAPLTYDYPRARRSAQRSRSSGPRGPPSTRSRCTPSPTRSG